MTTLSKRKKLAREKVDAATFYEIDEALILVKELATSKFPESIDVSVNFDVASSLTRISASSISKNSQRRSFRRALMSR